AATWPSLAGENPGACHARVKPLLSLSPPAFRPIFLLFLRLFPPLPPTMGGTLMPTRTTRMRATPVLVALAPGPCSAAPRDAYFPRPNEPATVKVGQALHRAAVAAGDDPDRYSFAFIKTRIAVAMSDEEATLYVSDGLASLPVPVVEAAVAHE